MKQSTRRTALIGLFSLSGGFALSQGVVRGMWMIAIGGAGMLVLALIVILNKDLG